MQNQIRYFFAAMLFFTRMQVPKAYASHSVEDLQKANRYFSWMGAILALISYLVYVVTDLISFSELAIAATMVTGIWITGAFHEDGFADCCDAFGGGWTKEKILTIMKDSRLGTFGVVGLIGILGVKYVLLQQLAATPLEVSTAMSPLFRHLPFLGMLLAAHSLSRTAALGIMQWSDYVQDIDSSKSKPLSTRKSSLADWFISLIPGVLGLLLLPPLFAICIVPIAIAVYQLMQYFNKWIGGYTGDCLGATQQVAEIICYLSWVIILPFV